MGKGTAMIDILISKSATRVFIPVPEAISLAELEVVLRNTTDKTPVSLPVELAVLNGYTLEMEVGPTEGLLWRGEWEYEVSNAGGKVCEGLARVYDAEGDSITQFQNDISIKQYGE
jgi:hypothetical protein